MINQAEWNKENTTGKKNEDKKAKRKLIRLWRKQWQLKKENNEGTGKTEGRQIGFTSEQSKKEVIAEIEENKNG